MRFFYYAAFAFILLLPGISRAEVPVEIVNQCAEKWGVDYEMRLFCQNKQMAAYQELQRQNSAVGTESHPEWFGRESFCNAGEHNEEKLYECGSDLKHETDNLNKTYKALRKTLNRDGRNLVLDLQRKWIKKRDEYCKLNDWVSENSNVYAADVIDCLTKLTVARRVELSSMLK